jgi:hypothetical protein
MKKTYLQPTMQVVTLQQQGIICTSPGGSSVTSVDGEVFDVIESDEDYLGGAR